MIKCQGVSLQLGGKSLLDNASFTIQVGEKVAIIGRNGAGKSSLLGLIEGKIEPDSGQFDTQGARIASLPQSVPADCKGLVGDVVMSVLSEDERWERQHELEPLLLGLGVSEEKRVEELSGGQVRRVLLAKALIQKPDVLLLDEPTNHLDMEAIQWLERFLIDSRITLLLVTHDRSLLQAVATAILTVDVYGTTLWRGDYQGYLAHQKNQEASREKEESEFDKRLAEEEVWIRKGIQARRTRNEGRVRALKAMREEHSARKQKVGKVNLSSQELRSSGKLVLEVEGLTHAFDDQVIVKDFSCLVSRASKIGIVGPNGAGKTTLLRCMLGELTPDAGEVSLGTQLSVAYFDQYRRILNDTDTILEAVAGGCDFIEIAGEKKHIYSYLQDFLFTPDKARARISTLSGGERNRVMLAKYLAQSANVLVLDEPTNDLDIETLELLEDYLCQYQGTVFLISHDRSFLNNVVTQTWLFKGNGLIEQHVGGLDSYVDLQAMSQKELQKSKDRNTKGPSVSALSYDERKEYNRLPSRIASKEKKIAELHKIMADSSFYQGSPKEIESSQQKCADLERECEVLYARWEELELKQN